MPQYYYTGRAPTFKTMRHVYANTTQAKGAVAEVYDTRKRPATMSHFVCLSHRLNQGRYALVPAPLEGKYTTIYMDVCYGTSDFGLPSPIKMMDEQKK